jgi:hypothetical protein
MNYTIMNRLKNPVTKIHSVCVIMWLQFITTAVLNDFSLRSFVMICADDLEILVSCARHLRDF